MFASCITEWRASESARHIPAHLQPDRLHKADSRYLHLQFWVIPIAGPGCYLRQTNTAGYLRRALRAPRQESDTWAAWFHHGTASWHRRSFRTYRKVIIIGNYVIFQLGNDISQPVWERNNKDTPTRDQMRL